MAKTTLKPKRQPMRYHPNTAAVLVAKVACLHSRDRSALFVSIKFLEDEMQEEIDIQPQLPLEEVHELMVVELRL